MRAMPPGKAIDLEEDATKWAVLTFGKYRSLSLPQIIFRDPDWFFWLSSSKDLYGVIRERAEDIARKARAIKIPKPDPENWAAEYQCDRDNRFLALRLVPADSPHYPRRSTRQPYLDLSWTRQQKAYDKGGGRKLIRDFVRIFFGRHKNLTKERCEGFFSNDENFIAIAREHDQGW
jgi:hypothetical protein